MNGVFKMPRLSDIVHLLHRSPSSTCLHSPTSECDQQKMTHVCHLLALLNCRPLCRVDSAIGLVAPQSFSNKIVAK